MRHLRPGEIEERRNNTSSYTVRRIRYTSEYIFGLHARTVLYVFTIRVSYHTSSVIPEFIVPYDSNKGVVDT